MSVVHHTISAAALLCCAISAAAGEAGSEADAARSQMERPYIGVSGGHVWTDDVRGVDHGNGIQLTLGMPLSTRWNLELSSSYFNLDADTPSDFYRTSLGADLLYVFRPQGFTPFFGIGAGAAYNDVVPDNRDDYNAYGNVALGVFSSPFSAYGLRLRADVRYVYETFDGDPKDVQAFLGLVFPMRRPRTVEIVRTQVQEVTKEVVREAPLRDADEDGVPDPIDHCPDTLRGAATDRYGCVEAKSVIGLKGVDFEFNSATLTVTARGTLDEAVSALAGQPSMRIEVAGHTDSTGTAAYNKRLSQLRAESVAAYLVSHGIASGRMTAVGYGEEQLLVLPGTDAANRRVELRVLTR